MDENRFLTAKSLLEELLDADVLVERDGGLEPSTRFLARRQEWLDRSPDPGSSEIPFDTDGTVLERLDDDARRTVTANALAVLNLAADLTPSRALTCGLSLRRLEEMRTSGVPEGFQALLGAELPAFVSQHPTAVVLVWQSDSDPCETVRDDLETLFEAGEIPDEVGKAAVEGAVDTELLATEYGVTAVPTLLFFVDGTVDSRLVGAHYLETVRSEIDTIVESTTR